MGIEDAKRKLFGLQYHPEVAHSEKGRDLLRHFLFKIAEVPADWKMEDVLQEEMQKISQLVTLFHACHSIPKIALDRRERRKSHSR